MIRKVGCRFRVVARTGRNMGTYDTLAEAKRRLQQIEIFKSLTERGTMRTTKHSRSPVDRALHDHIVALAREYANDVLARRAVGDSRAEYHAQHPKVKAYAALVHAGLTPKQAIAYFRKVSALPSPRRRRTGLLGRAVRAVRRVFSG